MSYFQNEVKVGSPSGPTGTNPDWGYGTCDQSVAISANAGAGTKNHTFYLPNCRINTIMIDVETAWDSVTSATLSVGTTGAPTLFTSGINSKTGGRTIATFTAAQCTAIRTVAAGAYTAQVVQVGTGSAGAGNVRIHYAPIKP